MKRILSGIARLIRVFVYSILAAIIGMLLVDWGMPVYHEYPYFLGFLLVSIVLIIAIIWAFSYEPKEE